MAYDRYDTRDDRSRWSDHDRPSDRERGVGRGRGEFGRDERPGGFRGRDERGFFERAGDEIASWFGDEEAEVRRRRDQSSDEDRGRFWRDQSWDRGDFERDDDGFVRARRGFGDRGMERDRGHGYRPMTGDYGRRDHESEQFFAASGVGRGARALGDDRTDYGRRRERDFDPHYRGWRDRHMSDLDRDYDDYRRENQARFENDFGTWRERRMHKRGLLGQIREHMEVVGNDDEHVGTVDKIAGDRIILTKSDPDSGGVHHSLSCSDIDQVEGDRVMLDCSADQARERWRDESRSRALFEREDQGEMGPRMLDRSFEGTYR